MPAYKFKATSKNGKVIADKLSASSKKDAESILHDRELDILVLQPQKENSSFVLRFKRKSFPLKEKISLCRNLSLLINAGIPLNDAFELLINNTTNSTVKDVLQDISSSLREGETISLSMSKYPQYFSDVFLVMIKTGENSGSLSNSLSYLAKEFKQEEQLKQQVINSLLYPIVIVALMVVLGVIMLTFVLPKLGKALLQLKIDLPWTTKLLLNTSLFLEKNVFILVGLLLIIPILIFFIIRSKPGKKFFYSLALKLPLFSKIILEYNLARFTRILSTLLSAGVPVTQALEISSRSLSLGLSEGLLTRIQEKLAAGIALSSIFRGEKIFPPMVSQIISVGEKTGNLDQLLKDLSIYYQEEVENSLKNFIAVLEPVLMVVVGIAIGIMVISIIAPIYSIISRLQT